MRLPCFLLILVPVPVGLLLGGCAGGPAAIPGDPVAPPPARSSRAGEELAFLLKPPSTGVRSIDREYLSRTAPYRVLIAEAEGLRGEFRRIERVDGGGRRVWFFDGPVTVFLRIDVGNDGTVDQTQYFGPEGLFAVVTRLGEGRRTQRIYWPPGEPKIVEVRDNQPPYSGVWWRTDEDPFRRGRRDRGRRPQGTGPG